MPIVCSMNTPSAPQGDVDWSLVAMGVVMSVAIVFLLLQLT